MILKKILDLQSFYTVCGENPNGEIVPLTYGDLKVIKNSEYVDSFKKMFKEYLYNSDDSDNSLIALTVPDNELDDVNSRLSKLSL